MISTVIRQIDPDKFQSSGLPKGFEILELSPNKFYLTILIDFGYNSFRMDHVIKNSWNRVMAKLDKHKEWFTENGYGLINFNGSKRAWITSNNLLSKALIDFLKENPDITIAEFLDHLEKQLLDEYQEPTSVSV